jgi:hypothetical protein
MPGLSADRDASARRPMRWSTDRIERRAIIGPFTIATGGLAHAVGRDPAFADFSRPDGGFVDGELSIVCLDVDGVVVAHGGNPKLLGRTLANVNGQPIGIEVSAFGLAQGHGWLAYPWPNPMTKPIEPKAVYVLKAGDRTVCGLGYDNGAPP